MIAAHDHDDDVIDGPVLPQSISPHPKALWRFSVARFLERVAFYTMRHWLILFLIAKAGSGGDVNVNFQAYQWAIALLVFSQIPGGLFIDFFYSRRKAVVWGGAMLAVGYFTLAIDHDMATVGAFLLSFAGMGLYGVGSTGALAGYYRGRAPYLGAGMYIYTAAINVGAFVASLIIGFAAMALSWQQGCMVAGIVMMAGHVYLLAISRAFEEQKPKKVSESEAFASTAAGASPSNMNAAVVVVAVLTFSFAAFALHSGFGLVSKIAGSAPGLGNWSKLSNMSYIILGIGAAFACGYYFTLRPVRMQSLLGIGSIAAVAAGVIMPGILTMLLPVLGTSPTVISALLLMFALLAAETLVVAPGYTLVLERGGRFTHTLLGLLSALAYLPFFGVLFPTTPNLNSGVGMLVAVLAVAVMTLGGYWLLKKK